MTGPISDYGNGTGLRDGVDNLAGTLVGLVDQTAGELGPAGPLGMLDDVIDGATDRSEWVEDRLEGLPFYEDNQNGTDAVLRDVHNDVIDYINSDDAATRAEGEALRDAMRDNGFWDDGYEQHRQDVLDDRENEEEDEGPEEPDPGPGNNDGRPTDDADPTPQRRDPLIIDLDGDGVELTTLEASGVFFDLDGNGFAERTGWVGADDGLLVRDLNGDGNIGDINELFGDTDGFADGFESLASLDDNADGIIDLNDAVYADLKVWQDLNGDGVSQAGELTSLTDRNIESISLSTTTINQTIAGHQVPKSSTVSFTDGSTQQVVDVFFETNPYSTIAVVPPDYQNHPEAPYLPQLFATGNMAATVVAFTEDAALRQQAKDLLELLKTGQIQTYHAAFEQFLFDWAGVGGVDPNGRGPHIDGQRLAFLETSFGRDFMFFIGQQQFNDPDAAAAGPLNGFFEEQMAWYSIRFIAQAATASAMVDTAVGVTGVDLDVTLTAYENHILSEFSGMVDEYSPGRQALSYGVPTLLTIVSNLVANGMSAEDAASIGQLARFDLGPTQENFQRKVLAFAPDAGLTLGDEVLVRMAYGTTHAVTLGTSGDDTLTATGTLAYIRGFEGNDQITGSAQGTIFDGGEGDDTLNGGEASDIYVYRLGDGNDQITDFDFSSNSGTDVLAFVDATIGDVTFSQGTSNNLEITLSNGDVITIIDHFNSNGDNAIDVISFSDGTSLDLQQTRDKTVADMAATNGVVLGTELSENYFYNLGDGPVTITDFDFSSNSGTDRLTLDVNEGDVTFAQNATGDLEITFSNGDVVTIINHFDSDGDFAMDEIIFADGTVLALQAIRDKSVADMAATTGAAVGTELGENYVYNLGDGPLTITDFDFSSNSGTDTLTLDVNLADVTFAQGTTYDLEITFSNGDVVTIINQFDSDGDFAIDQIIFADTTVLGLQAIRDKTVADMAATTGVVVGTELAENYVYNLGDGSVVITDFDFSSISGTDTLTLDVNASDVSFAQGASLDLEITFSNGDVVTIVDHFNSNDDFAMDQIIFADGTVFGLQEIRDKSVADMAATGTVVGTELAENYFYNLGDGSVTITDFDFSSNSGVDRLTLDVNAGDVSFGQGASNDLEITFSNGDVVTIINQFDSDGDFAIDQIIFDDGTVLGLQGIRDKSVADMAATGTVLGTELAENYVYNLGDGSLTITDFDFSSNSGTDTLTLDVNPADVTFAQGTTNDLEITFSNGDVVTIIDHFDSDGDNAMDQIIFADGTVLGLQGIRNKSVADMIPTGTVLGSELAENYFYNLGDGSVTITDFDFSSNSGTDTLTLDVNPADVTFAQGTTNDLEITFSNGDVVTIIDHFDSDGDNAMDQIIFDDGTVLGLQGIRDKSVADMVATGTVLGTELAENYFYDLGDGPVTITDFDFSSNSGTDRLTLDVNPADVTFAQGTTNDLEIAFSNGDVVTIINHFDSDGDFAMDQIIFDDGTVLGLQGTRDKSVADMMLTGTVLGTELAENYVYTLGSGSVTITDFDFSSNSGTDTLTLNVNPDDVTFGQGTSNDLELTFANGDIVTIVNHFDSDIDFAIDQIIFGDGTVLGLQGTRDKSVADMMATGVVLGTELAENYVYNYGDGSVVITDFDFSSNSGTDTLTLDVDPLDVLFIAGASNDLLITFANSDVITIVNHFDSDGDFAMDVINFADGTSLNLAGIATKVAEDVGRELTDPAVDGTAGDDLMIGDAERNVLNGLEGNDTLRGFADDDTLSGGLGADAVNGGFGDDNLMGDEGNDTLYGQDGNDLIFGGDGDDLLEGSFGDDTLDGGAGTNLIRGGAGNDSVLTGDEGDVAFGGDGDDTVLGGSAGDDLDGGNGSDSIDGGAGDDLIVGGRDMDTLEGGAGADTMRGEGGNDLLTGGADNDLMFGSSGEDTVSGGDGDDVVEGNAQADQLFGDAGQDTLRGGDGFDGLNGGLGNDILAGGNGNDTLDGGAGQDTLRGQAGNDTFVFADVSDSAFGAADLVDGVDGVGAAGGDVIDLSAIDADLALAGDQAFVFIGEATTAQGLAGGAGTLWVENVGGQSRLYGLVDGDNAVDLAIRINDGTVLAADYLASDLIL